VCGKKKAAAHYRFAFQLKIVVQEYNGKKERRERQRGKEKKQKHYYFPTFIDRMDSFTLKPERKKSAYIYIYINSSSRAKKKHLDECFTIVKATN